jgi:hypothetical protein
VVQGESERRHRFDALFDADKRDVAAYCSWRTTSPSDAEDAVAEVFLVAPPRPLWRALAPFEPFAGCGRPPTADVESSSADGAVVGADGSRRRGRRASPLVQR